MQFDSLIRTIRDFVIDFIGALAPGILLTFGICFFVIPEALSLTSWYLDYMDFWQNSSWPAQSGLPGIFVIWRKIWGFIHDINLAQAIVIAFLSYVMGQFLFRRNIELPDSMSFHFITQKERENSPAFTQRQTSRSGKDREKILGLHHCLAIRVPAFFSKMELKLLNRAMKTIAERIPWRSGEIIHYPYDNLRGYLQRKGLLHLAELVPWSEHDPTLRSRVLTNSLKCRIGLAFPENYTAIAYREAVIRLMNSIYYITSLMWISISIIFLFSIIGIVLALAQEGFSKTLQIQSEISTITATSGATLFAICLLRKQILHNLHSARVGEVVLILETAHYLNVMYPDKNILSNMPDHPSDDGQLYLMILE